MMGWVHGGSQPLEENSDEALVGCVGTGENGVSGIDTLRFVRVEGKSCRRRPAR